MIVAIVEFEQILSASRKVTSTQEKQSHVHFDSNNLYPLASKAKVGIVLAQRKVVFQIK